MDVFNWIETQLVWDPIGLGYHSFESQLIWHAVGLKFIRFEIQWIGEKLNLRLNWFENQFSSDSNWKLEKEAFGLPSTMKIQSFKTKLVCETATNHANRNLESWKRSFFARLPSKTQVASLKMRLVCGTSFKNWIRTETNIAFFARFPSRTTRGQPLHQITDFYADASKVSRLPRKSSAKANKVLWLPH